jgi:hypothetical protein
VRAHDTGAATTGAGREGAEDQLAGVPDTPDTPGAPDTRGEAEARGLETGLGGREQQGYRRRDNTEGQAEPHQEGAAGGRGKSLHHRRCLEITLTGRPGGFSCVEGQPTLNQCAFAEARACVDGSL